VIVKTLEYVINNSHYQGDVEYKSKFQMEKEHSLASDIILKCFLNDDKVEQEARKVGLEKARDSVILAIRDNIEII